MQKDRKINNGNNKLEEKNKIISKLENDILEKNKIISKLEKDILNLNESYKNDLIIKSKEAQNKINEKINEYKLKVDIDSKNFKKYAIKNYAIDLINIINQFNSVVNSNIENEAVKNYVSGFKMFLQMFQNLLISMNINEIEIHENDLFNENFMEAVDIKIDPNKNENTIFQVIKKGYKLHDQILIYAQVIVYKKK